MSSANTDSTARPSERHLYHQELLYPAIIFCLALLLRVIYLFSYHSSDYWDIMPLDPFTHDLMARRMALAGDWLGAHSFFRAPMYLYFLALIYKICGPGYLIPRIIQSIIGSMSAVLIYLAAKKLLSRKAAMAAGMGMSAFWANIYFDNELLTEPLVIFFDLLVLYALVSGFSKTKGKSLVLGMLMGLSAITRPNILPFALLVIAGSLFMMRSRPLTALSRAGLILIGLAVPISPVTIRNYIVDRDFVLIASQGGINFWMGNNAQADGLTAIVPAHPSDMPSDFLAAYRDYPWFHEEVWLSSAYGAQMALKHRPRESEISDYWYAQARTWIFKHPLDFGRLMLKKTYFLFHRIDVSNNRDLAYHVRQFTILRALHYLHFGLLTPLALLGLYPAWRRRGAWVWVWLFFFAYGFSVVLFFVNTRYRMPLVPVFFILAALAAERGIELVKEKDFSRLAVAALIWLVLTAASNIGLVPWNDRPLRAAMHYNLGISMSQHKRWAAGERELREAVGIKDNFPEAHLSLGNVLAAQGRYGEAVRELNKSLEQKPDYAEAHYNLGLTLLKIEDYQSAARHLEQAHSLAPETFPPLDQILPTAPADRSP